jgi:hypothetical protein
MLDVTVGSHSMHEILNNLIRLLIYEEDQNDYSHWCYTVVYKININ